MCSANIGVALDGKTTDSNKYAQLIYTIYTILIHLYLKRQVFSHCNKS